MTSRLVDGLFQTGVESSETVRPIVGVVAGCFLIGRPLTEGRMNRLFRLGVAVLLTTGFDCR